MDYKMLLLVMTIVTIVYLPLSSFVRADRRIGILGLLALCYVVGKTVQFWHTGPLIIRWYLSDVGFVPCFAFLALHIRKDPVLFARIALAIACLQELCMIFLVNPYVIPGTFGARGDWIDLVIFYSTYGVSLALLSTTPSTAPAHTRRSTRAQNKRPSR